jgi:prepilin-type N-terminal cleavage/methylation domain-containing protein
MSRHDQPSAQRGFTLVEVLVAISILLVGVLGVVSLVDGANAVTSKTRAREAGTNLARSIIEVSRSVRYRDLTTSSLLAALEARPALADSLPGTPGHTIRSRSVDYRLTLSVCSLDDPKDNLGDHNNGVLFCSDTDALGVGQTAVDRNPDDYKRVRVTLDWQTRSTAHSITQTSAIINPVGGLGPSVVRLDMTQPTSGSDPYRIESDLVKSAHFVAQTSTSAAQLTWSVSGDSQGEANGSGTSFDFDWVIERSNGEIAYYDCTYVIQADAFDEQGRGGTPRARTVIVNRMAPIKPADFTGGRNGNGLRVDLQWAPSPECDVLGYRVYRSTSAGVLGTQITCFDQAAPEYTTEATCLDESAPAGTLYYTVRGVDTASNGSLREGVSSDQIAVGGANAVPSKPTSLTSCIGGASGCNAPDGQPAPAGMIVIRWDASTDSDGTIQLYRIYRDGVTYADRVDVFFPEGGELAWFESEPDGQTHAYRVSAVDDDFGESELSDPVDAP